MKNLILTLLVMVCVVCLSACNIGSTKQIGPSETEVKEGIYSHFAKFNGGKKSKETFKVDDFQIVSAENTGNTVDENIVGRYSGTLVLTKPLYVFVTKLDDGTEVIEVNQEKGLITPFSGRYESTVSSLSGKTKNWSTSFNLDKITENGWEGRPINRFSNAVIIGSPEYNSKINELAEIQKEREVKEKLAQEKFINDVSGDWQSVSGAINLYGGGRYLYKRNIGRLKKKSNYLSLTECKDVKNGQRVFEMSISKAEGKSTSTGKTRLMNLPGTNTVVNYETTLNAEERSLSVKIESHDVLPCIQNKIYDGTGSVFYPQKRSPGYISPAITYETKRAGKDKIILTSTDFRYGTLEITFKRKS